MYTKGGVKKGIILQWNQLLVILEEASNIKNCKNRRKNYIVPKQTNIKDVIIPAINNAQVLPVIFLASQTSSLS